MLRSMANLNADSSNFDATSAATDDVDDNVAVLHERQNGIDDDTTDVKLDDCDVFKCELASLGRKAYDLVTELRESGTSRR